MWVVRYKFEGRHQWRADINEGLEELERKKRNLTLPPVNHAGVSAGQVQSQEQYLNADLISDTQGKVLRKATQEGISSGKLRPGCSLAFKGVTVMVDATL